MYQLQHCHLLSGISQNKTSKVLQLLPIPASACSSIFFYKCYNVVLNLIKTNIWYSCKWFCFRVVQKPDQTSTDKETKKPSISNFNNTTVIVRPLLSYQTKTYFCTRSRNSFCGPFIKMPSMILLLLIFGKTKSCSIPIELELFKTPLTILHSWVNL